VNYLQNKLRAVRWEKALQWWWFWKLSGTAHSDTNKGRWYI